METKRLMTATVWYSHKLDGTPYTFEEKKNNKNRFFHPSFDYIEIGMGKKITVHNEAWTKMLKMLERRRKTIITALVETTINGKPYHVIKVTRAEFSVYAEPVFVPGKGANDFVVRTWKGNPRPKIERRVAA